MNILPRVKKIYDVHGEAGKDRSYRRDDTVPNEGYRIEADEKGTVVVFSDEAGKFYAEKTLAQIERGEGKIPCCIVEDEPVYPYRGFMIDCCRHFFTVEELKRQIDVAAELKLNRFHWHLTDDQGWRAEIKKYPLLTEIGSVRKQTRGDGKERRGFYTREDMKEVVKYCAERFIEVVPEIDMPGHFSAAIAAYPILGCTGEKIAVSERFGIHDNIACAGKESTFLFVKDVLDEICDIFPSEYIHIGGDEALKYRYLDCPDCQKAIIDNRLNDEEELQCVFLNRVIKHLESLGRKAIVWNDGTVGGKLEGDFCVQYWQESAKNKTATKNLVRGGKRVIYSPFSRFYLDYPAGMTSLKKTYNYNEEEISSAATGLEAPLWTEYIDDVQKLEKNAYPRLFAVAERAWSGRGDYAEFLSSLDGFEEYLVEKYDINYDKDPNPSFFKGKAQVFRFFINAFDKSTFDYLKKSYRTAKEIKKRKKKRKSDLQS